MNPRRKFNRISDRYCPNCGERLRSYTEILDDKHMTKTTELLECPNCDYDKILKSNRKAKRSVEIPDEA